MDSCSLLPNKRVRPTSACQRSSIDPRETSDTVLDIAERAFDEPRVRLAAAWRSRILQYEQMQPHPRKGG